MKSLFWVAVVYRRKNRIWRYFTDRVNSNCGQPTGRVRMEIRVIKVGWAGILCIINRDRVNKKGEAHLWIRPGVQKEFAVVEGTTDNLK